MERVEERFEEQQEKVNKLVDEKIEESERKIREADLLLRNVRGSFKTQNDRIQREE